jgi:hypothetical protein
MNYLKPAGYGARPGEIAASCLDHPKNLSRQPNSEPRRSTSKVVHRIYKHRKQATLRHSVSCSRIGFMKGLVVALLGRVARSDLCPLKRSKADIDQAARSCPDL